MSASITAAFADAAFANRARKADGVSSGIADAADAIAGAEAIRPVVVVADIHVSDLPFGSGCGIDV